MQEKGAANCVTRKLWSLLNVDGLSNLFREPQGKVSTSPALELSIITYPPSPLTPLDRGKRLLCHMRTDTFSPDGQAAKGVRADMEHKRLSCTVRAGGTSPSASKDTSRVNADVFVDAPSCWVSPG